MKKTALGRGLDAILVDTREDAEERINVLRISDVEPKSDQPRQDFDMESLEALSESIKKYGVLQPITVRPLANGNYQIIAGERRWRAARMAGLTEIPVTVIEADDEKAASVALVENLQRRDLSPVEEASAYLSLIEDYGLTHEEISKRVGKSRAQISNVIRVLDLPDEALKLLRDGEISLGHAKVLLSLPDDALTVRAAKTVSEKDLSVRDTEKLVKRLIAESEPKPPKILPAVDYGKELENAVRSIIGRPVHLAKRGKVNTISIEYQDNDDLQEILKLLCGDDVKKLP
ncbi:MAG: ParB/RepB/Spo0J family partition protein [Clostridia bacterium]|nr:ParB/RepB/Spo0J family partition protein [Clostridia bacterium]